MIAGFVPLSILAALHAENHMQLRQSVVTKFISIEQKTNIILLRNHNRQKPQKSAERNDRLYPYRWNKIYNYDMFGLLFCFHLKFRVSFIYRRFHLLLNLVPFRNII